MSKSNKRSKDSDDITRIDHRKFSKDIDVLISEAEEARLRKMRQHRMRSFVVMNLNILFVALGVAGFGWFFLVKVEFIPAILSIIISLIPPILLHIWAEKPIRSYINEHKSVFMPKLAKALGGLAFYPKRGVSAKIIDKLGVVPSYGTYKAEDCFMGTYKGVKVIFSEARLYSKQHKNKLIFDGIFVLLETPGEVIDGHTVITADYKMVKEYSCTRWKSMKQVYVDVSDSKWDKFQIYSTKPASAELVVGERLLKELSETSDIFDNSALTAVLFGRKYVFIMIPYAQNMFEASNLFVPVKTKAQAMKCKKEIEQLLEIIDIFDLYKPIEPT